MNSHHHAARDPQPWSNRIAATSKPVAAASNPARLSWMRKLFAEAAGLLHAPERAFPLAGAVLSHGIRSSAERRHLYSYATTKADSTRVLELVVRWVLTAQRADGGVPAYYSLLTGYSKSYPEVTGYLVPTLYNFAKFRTDSGAATAAERATRWLLSLQMPDGAFPGGLQGGEGQASIFNTGQILHGLTRGHKEIHDPAIGRAAIAAADWLVQMQCADGSWSGPGSYQGGAHTYYIMVSWALAELSKEIGDPKYGEAAERNLNWTLSYFRPTGWIDGINLEGYPEYSHFIAYVLQGALECAVLRDRNDAIEAAAKSAWLLLRKFETNKCLYGAYERDFKNGKRFACLTGNAQMSCVWLRLFEVTGDLRYFNAALKMNEMLKRLIPARGGPGIAGGISGSYPIWGDYQPLRYISWGCKFFADALLHEQRLKKSLVASPCEVLECAS